MGVIKSSITDIHGKKTETEVRTNKFEDFVIEVSGLFGHKREWQMVHKIEKRKLAK